MPCAIPTSWAALTPAQTAVAVALIAIGAVVAFLGYRLFRVILVLIGLVAGMAAGWLIAFQAAGENRLVIALVGMIGGFTGMSLFVFLYLPGVFLAGVALGALLVTLLAVTGGQPPHPIPMTAAGLVGGVASLWVERHAVTIATAAFGTLAAALGALALLSGHPPHAILRNPGLLGRDAFLAFVGWIVLAIGAATVQFLTLPREPEPEPEPEPAEEPEEPEQTEETAEQEDAPSCPDSPDASDTETESP